MSLFLKRPFLPLARIHIFIPFIAQTLNLLYSKNLHSCVTTDTSTANLRKRKLQLKYCVQISQNGSYYLFLLLLIHEHSQRHTLQERKK